MNQLIIVSGPTATGKTKTSIELAKFIKSTLKIEAVIVNFDSLLFYKEISIGTAKPSLTERENIPHYMIGIESISSPLNAADFIKKAETLITELMNKNICVILVGGSAFYLRALIKGMYVSDSPSDEVKLRIETLYAQGGITPIIDFLKMNDPESLNNYHINDHYRLIRAAIHFESTKTKISEQKNLLNTLSPYDLSKCLHPWNILHLYLDIPKDQHYQIIMKRTQKMFEDGLLNEIQDLKNAGFTLKEKPLNSIGYKEAIEFLNHQFKDQEACIERISISTRQLAKSQRTFFNKMTPKICFNPQNDLEKIFTAVEQFLS